MTISQNFSIVFVAILLVMWTAALGELVSFGLPTTARIQTILAGRGLLDVDLAALGAQREIFFEAVERDRAALVNFAAEDELPDRILPAYDLFSKTLNSDARVESDIRIALLRLALVRGLYADESLTLSGLSRMRPSQLDFDPKSYLYGGAYLYPVGAIIFGLGSTGLIDLRPGVADYIDDPGGIAGMYMVARGVNAAAFLILIFLVFDFARRLDSPLAAVFAVVAISSATGLWQFSFVAKPHLYAAMWATLCVYSLFRYVDRDRAHPGRVWLAAAALGAGMAAGAAIGQGLVAVSAFVLLPFAHRGRITFWPALLVGAGTVTVFAATNPYYILSYQQFLLDLQLGGSAYDRTSASLGHLFSYFTDLPASLGIMALVFGLVGLARSAIWGGRIRRQLVVFVGLTFLIGGIVFSEIRLSLYSIPLICVFAGIGSAVFVRSLQSRLRFLGGLAAAIAIGAPILGGLAAAIAIGAPSAVALGFSFAVIHATDAAVENYKSWAETSLRDPASIGLAAFPPQLDFSPPLLIHELLDVRPQVLAQLDSDDPARSPGFVFLYGADETSSILDDRYEEAFEARGPKPPAWLSWFTVHPVIDWRLAVSIWQRLPSDP